MKDKKNKSKEDSAKALKKEIASLTEQLESVQQERDDLLGKLQRISADYANFQKRVPKQISDSVAFEKESVIKSFLSTLDNFEHTLNKSHAAETVDIVLDGVRIVYDQMTDVLKSHGVERIDAVDEPFDPSRHEAMLRREEPDKADSVVLEEFQKGYTLNGRVIRPSKVVVNRVARNDAPTPPPPPAEDTADGDPEEDPQATDEAERPSEE